MELKQKNEEINKLKEVLLKMEVLFIKLIK